VEAKGVAVVTGASRGIGRAIALGCAEAGAAVSICARGADGVAAVRDRSGHSDDQYLDLMRRCFGFEW